jgi:hypothetical protein
VLLGVEPAGASAATAATRRARGTAAVAASRRGRWSWTHRAGRMLAGSEPGHARPWPQPVVGIELRRSRDERRRRDDPASLALLGLLGVEVDRVVIADRAREHHHVRGFDRKVLGCHAASAVGLAA